MVFSVLQLKLIFSDFFNMNGPLYLIPCYLITLGRSSWAVSGKSISTEAGSRIHA